MGFCVCVCVSIGRVNLLNENSAARGLVTRDNEIHNPFTHTHTHTLCLLAICLVIKILLFYTRLNLFMINLFFESVIVFQHPTFFNKLFCSSYFIYEVFVVYKCSTIRCTYIYTCIHVYSLYIYIHSYTRHIHTNIRTYIQA